MNNDFSTLKRLALKREGYRKRCSSYDKTGGNNDFIRIKTGENVCIADIKGSGCINHIWMTCVDPLKPIKAHKQYYLRQMVLRIYWDNEENPSVEVPIGDFFGLGHARTKNFSSFPLNMSPEDGMGFNSYFAMPFSSKARIEIENEYENIVFLYYYIDYESYSSISSDYLRFHASWRRENPCHGIDDKEVTNEYFEHGGKNLTGENNYLIMQAEGEGHYVGCHLDIHNLRYTREWNWYGEGDDMIFIDGDVWPPTLHGTGTEDYFNTAFCPTQEIYYPYHGIIFAGDPNWLGKITLYRYHIEDPIIFKKSIKVTIEHGHNNHRSDDYSSTAYWYQTEPHKRFEKLLSANDRLPLRDIKRQNIEELRKYLHLS